MNAIEVASLTRKIGSITALENVSFSVPTGSICGLLGRNGAGKTTVMSIIAGQDRPTSGKVRVFGEQPFENGSVLAKINFVRDNQRYPDDYKIGHVLRIAPEFAPQWNADVANEAVDGFRIPLRTPIKKFSRGQLSSVAIVLGLASRSPITLLDEPYLGLDVTARALFHEMLLRDYTAHPRTVVLSTHLIEESEALFDRVFIIDRGRVRVDAESEEIANLAYTLSGLAEAVDSISSHRTVLQSHSVAVLKSVTIAGQCDVDTEAEAKRLGVQIKPATLQELVAAFGADNPRTTEEKLGSRS